MLFTDISLVSRRDGDRAKRVRTNRLHMRLWQRPHRPPQGAKISAVMAANPAVAVRKKAGWVTQAGACFRTVVVEVPRPPFFDLSAFSLAPLLTCGAVCLRPSAFGGWSGVGESQIQNCACLANSRNQQRCYEICCKLTKHGLNSCVCRRDPLVDFSHSSFCCWTAGCCIYNILLLISDNLRWNFLSQSRVSSGMCQPIKYYAIFYCNNQRVKYCGQIREGL
jgi:hypothetical protein